LWGIAKLGRMTTFGDRFRAARNALGYTQDELAERLEVTKAAISAWENNREKPAFDKLPRIREAVACSLDELVCGIGGAAWQRTVAVREDAHAWGRPALNSTDRDEVRLITRFRSMNERQRKALIVVLDGVGGRT
jgi:transcriptional regulator with XRE-family HTH domain